MSEQDMEWEFHKPQDVGPVPLCLGTVADADCRGIAVGLPWDCHGTAHRHRGTGQGTRSACSCHCLGVLWYLELASWERWGEVPSWGAMEAGGNAHPIVPEHACVRQDVRPGAPPQAGTRDTDRPALPGTGDLAKPEPGQLVWKGCRRRARYFSFFLGTDWFKSVSQ